MTNNNKQEMDPVFIQPPPVDVYSDSELETDDDPISLDSAQGPREDMMASVHSSSPEKAEQQKKRAIARTVLSGSFVLQDKQGEAIADIEATIPEGYQGSLESWHKTHFTPKPQIGLEEHKQVPTVNYRLDDIKHTEHYAEAVGLVAQLRSIVEVYGTEILGNDPVKTVDEDENPRPIANHPELIDKARSNAKKIQKKLLKLKAMPDFSI